MITDVEALPLWVSEHCQKCKHYGHNLENALDYSVCFKLDLKTSAGDHACEYFEGKE